MNANDRRRRRERVDRLYTFWILGGVFSILNGC